MKKLTTTTLMAAALAASPAFAQTSAPKATEPTVKSQADCQANWKAADKNGDAKLDAAEISMTKELVPIALTGKTSITEQEFLSACGQTVQGGAKK
jgi:hypothetical protein